MMQTGPSDMAQFRVQRHFSDHRAVTPADAIEYVPSGPAERRAFDRLRARGVIRQTVPAYYWFDLDRMGRVRVRRGLSKTPVAIALAVILTGIALWVFGPIL